MLYFFGGSHTVMEADFKALKKISRVANILPVVSLADTFTAKELLEYKQSILDLAASHGVRFFNCLDSLTDLGVDQDEI